MLTQLEARLAVVDSIERQFHNRLGAIAALVATAITLGGCLPATTPLVGPDPADPSARVAGVSYRSALAPYTSLRPTAPSSWRQQRDRAPASKSGE